MVSFITQIFKEPLVPELALWPLILLTNGVYLNIHGWLLVLFCFTVPCSWHSTEILLNDAWCLFLKRNHITCNIWVFQVWYEGLRRSVHVAALTFHQRLHAVTYPDHVIYFKTLFPCIEKQNLRTVFHFGEYISNIF